MFVALQHRNFRLLWIGLLISFSGSFMQSAAVLWHVSILVPEDRRALALGLVGLIRVVPIIGGSTPRRPSAPWLRARGHAARRRLGRAAATC